MEILLPLILICIPPLIMAWIFPEKWQLYPITIFTAIFIGYYSPVSLLILTITTITSFYLAKNLGKKELWCILGILQAVFIFLIFKNNNSIFNESIIPLGMSYYFFRQIHYSIESYKGKLPEHSFKDYLFYMFFLPVILIGPINLFQDFFRDIKRRRWDSSLFSSGLERILYGFAKIVILGNYLITSKFINLIEPLQEQHIWLYTYIDSFRFFANAYVQFAGYSDIAIGLSMLFGFRMIENFNYPFLAKNIADFWQRWHISLSGWCREYVYYPVSSFTRKPYLGILCSMMVLAFWHEISLNYLLWGILHALAINIWYLYNNSDLQLFLKKYLPFPQVTGIFITLHFVVFSFILIKENNWQNIINSYKILFFGNV